MKILVTGAAGFIGRHLCAALCGSHEVVPVNRRRTGQASEIVQDLSENFSVCALPGRVDAIVHCAGIVGDTDADARRYYNTNVNGTHQLLQYASATGVRKFVLFSTGAVYRQTAHVLSEESELGPNGIYARSKLNAEFAAQCYESEFDVQILRLFFPYGAGQAGRLVPRLVQTITDEQPIPLNNALGQPFITPIYISDLVLCVQMVLSLSGSFVVNIAGPSRVSIRELALLIGDLRGKTPRFVVNSETQGVNWIGDSRKAGELIGFHPSIAPDEGLRRMLGTGAATGIEPKGNARSIHLE